MFSIPDRPSCAPIVPVRRHGCLKTRPESVSRIKAGLVNAPRAEVRMFSGGREESNPCKAMSHHGNLGIEDQVVEAIAAFVLAPR